MLPEDVVSEATRLTRVARDATDDDERRAVRRRRDELLATHEYVARERDDDDTLILYPAEWVVDGSVSIERIDDTDRAIEQPLLTTDDDWETIEAYNQGIVEMVRAQRGEDHAANVQAFADFCSNHYGVTIDATTDTHRSEFRSEYYPRNAWPTPEQREIVEKSIEIALDCARQ